MPLWGPRVGLYKASCAFHIFLMHNIREGIKTTMNRKERNFLLFFFCIYILQNLPFFPEGAESLVC